MPAESVLKLRKRELEALVEEAEKQKAATLPKPGLGGFVQAAKAAAKAQPGVSACLKVEIE